MLWALLWKMLPAVGAVYIQGMFSYQTLNLSNSVTTAGSIDLTKAYVFSGEIGADVVRSRIGLRYDRLVYGVSAGNATNDLSQSIVWGLVGLPLGIKKSRFKVEPLVGLGYLLESQVVLENVQVSGVDVSGTYTNSGLAVLGAARFNIEADRESRVSVIVEIGYRFIVPVEFVSATAVLGGDTSGLYGQGGLRLAF